MGAGVSILICHLPPILITLNSLDSPVYLASFLPNAHRALAVVPTAAAAQARAFAWAHLAVGCRAMPSPPHLQGRLHLNGVAATFQKLDAILVREEESTFRKAAAAGHILLPLTRCIFSNHLTPVLVYRCLVREDDRKAPSFLFESVEQGSEGTNVGRYNVVGAQPTMEIVAKANHVTVMDHWMKSKKEPFASDSMKIPRVIMEQWNPQISDGHPDVFCGGWFGYFSYDKVRYVEIKKLPFSKAPHDDRNLPDIHLGLYNDIVVFDHVKKKTHVIHWVRVDCYHSVDEAYEDGKNWVEALLSRLHSHNVQTLSAGFVKLNVGHFGSALHKSSMSSEDYKKATVQVKEHIIAGDIFQVVLSQCFDRRFADPFEVYRARRIVNPSPYMAYLQARGCILVASSPDILTRLEKVTGELRDDLTCWDGLRAALHVGTTSGAPKVRAMELIDEMEGTMRGPYSGGFGGISFCGDMDITLALRTIVFQIESRFDTMYSYADTGIVADSKPDDKHQEFQNKAAGLARTIDLTKSTFLDE